MKPARLTEFMGRMEPNSVAVIAGAREVRRNADTDFEFRQDSDFHYLTGLDEPDCVAVVSPGHPEHRYVLFVRPRIREEEIWTGIRTGIEGAVGVHGADAAYDIARIDELLPRYLQNHEKLYFRFGADESHDRRIISSIMRIRERARGGAFAPAVIIDPATIVHEMRLRKNEQEIAALRRAAEISAEGHIEAMKHCRPGIYEYELEALVEYVFRKNGATGVGYPSIVGSGFNSTILHYNSNNDRIEDGDLVLIDAGAEYRLFSGDITRTFPANGRFSGAQHAVYQTVLDANREVIRMAAPGVSFMALHEKAVEIVASGLIDLGLLGGSLGEAIEKESYRKFFMHRTGHWLGLDVHDAGRYMVGDEWRQLEPGMVFTVEPGIYIAEGTEGVGEEFFNIGVRIEDDIVVTENGCEVLTSGAPKETAEIEALMRG